MSHVHFICEKLVESKDSARASCMAQSLLARLHSTGFDETEQEAVLECLGTVLELLDVMMPTQTLPFLESGDLTQRNRVLQVCATLNLVFEGQSRTELARCLVQDVESTSGNVSSTHSLLLYALET